MQIVIINNHNFVAPTREQSYSMKQPQKFIVYINLTL